MSAFTRFVTPPLGVAVIAIALGGSLPLVSSLSSAHAAAPPADEQTIIHVLNRVAFGPSTGDVEKVRQMGIADYIDQQLRPDRIPDGAMASKLEGLRTVGLSSREIADRFERPMIEQRRGRGRQQPPTPPADGQTPPPELSAARERVNALVVELSEQKILRAAYSERQLQEVLTDFWFNHFNVDARKGRDRFLLTEYERESIRPHVLGTFRDLLEATAKSPAMLFYLDNWMSVDPNSPRPGPNRRRTKASRGLNENYARELMELHTLGVDGGYTQKDVVEVARAFTGWTIGTPRQGGGFRFEPRLHDEGEKLVLGHSLKAGGGIGDGEQVLDILARHPSTARLIATKLARRFVSDEPPPALVEEAAKRFRETGGDLRAVTRTILTSPELLSSQAHRAKIKTPLEFIVSAIRATGAEVSDARPLVGAMRQLGMPLYQCQPPTGYKDTADAWANTGALVNRMNVALALARNTLPGITLASRQWAEGNRDVFIAAMLGRDVSEATRATIARATTGPDVVALTLGSPEFQKR